MNEVSKNFNRMDYVILSILLQSSADDAIKAMTITEIMDASGGCLKRTTTRKFLLHLKEHNMVNVSGKVNKAMTYYITSDGIQLLEGGKVI
jgi:repressor of nif and glnA expression